MDHKFKKQITTVWWGSYGTNPWHEPKHESWAHKRGPPHSAGFCTKVVVKHQKLATAAISLLNKPIFLNDETLPQMKNLLSCLNFMEDLTTSSSWHYKDSILLMRGEYWNGFAYSECWCQRSKSLGLYEIRSCKYLYWTFTLNACGAKMSLTLNELIECYWFKPPHNLQHMHLKLAKHGRFYQ